MINMLIQVPEVGAAAPSIGDWATELGGQPDRPA